MAVTLAEVPYRMDASNQAAWWKPLDEFGGSHFLAYNAWGGPGATNGGPTDTHTERLRPCIQLSRMMAAICRPLPTPVPSPRNAPARSPPGSTWLCRWPAYSTNSYWRSEIRPSCVTWAGSLSR